MDYQSIIDDLTEIAGMRSTSLRKRETCKDAANAITELIARAEEAEAENKSREEASFREHSAMHYWRDRARKAENERDAAQSIIAQDIGVTGVDKIKTCFGYPLEKVQELVEADKAGKCMVLPLKPGDEVYYIGWSACSHGWDDPGECGGCDDDCDSKWVVKSMRVHNNSWIVENFIDRENHYYYTSYHAAEAALKNNR